MNDFILKDFAVLFSKLCAKSFSAIDEGLLTICNGYQNPRASPFPNLLKKGLGVKFLRR